MNLLYSIVDLDPPLGPFCSAGKRVKTELLAILLWTRGKSSSGMASSKLEHVLLQKLIKGTGIAGAFKALEYARIYLLW